MIIQLIVYALVFLLAFIAGLLLVHTFDSFRDRRPWSAALFSTLGVLNGVPTIFAASHYPWTVAIGVGLGVFTMMKALYGKAENNRSDIR